MSFFKWLCGARSTSAEDYFNRGVSCSSQGAYDKAIAAFTEAIRLEPTNCSGACSSRAQAYFAKSEYDEAIADCTESLRLNPQNDNAYFIRGWSYSNTRQPARAIADFTELIRLAPSNAGAYYLRGICYANLGDNDSAIADFVEVARLDRRCLDPTGEPEWLVNLFAKAEKLFEQSKAEAGTKGNPGGTSG